MRMDRVVIRKNYDGRGYTATAFNTAWGLADQIIIDAGLSSVVDIYDPVFEWSNLETVIAVLRFNGISAEVEE